LASAIIFDFDGVIAASEVRPPKRVDELSRVRRQSRLLSVLHCGVSTLAMTSWFALPDRFCQLSSLLEEQIPRRQSFPIKQFPEYRVRWLSDACTESGFPG
jgi:hypothetical protein